jgi:hypothetical protein
MADQPTKLREVAWSELFPWLILLRSVRIALMARVLGLAAAGLIATTLGWRLLDVAFGPENDPVVADWRDEALKWVWNASPGFRIDTAARTADQVFGSAARDLEEAPLALWRYLTRPFTELFHGDLTARGFVFLLLCCVWELLVWGLAGGAITRIAALRFTRDEAPPLLAGVKQAARKLLSYSLPPLIALAGTAVFAVQLVILGWLMRLDVLALVAGIFWPFVIVLGLMMAILLLGALVGWPLMWSTVSVEGTDAFDALSRSYAYTYHRPFRLLWYVLFAALLAMVSMFVVKLFATSAIVLGDWSVDWGLDEPTMRSVVAPNRLPPPAPLVSPPAEVPQLEEGGSGAAEEPAGDADDEAAEERIEPNAMLRGARRTIFFWKSLVAALAAGYQAGFLWVAAVGVYLLLRRDIDGVLLSEVYIDQSDEYGLPPLADEATTAVPEIGPDAPAQPGDTGPA